MATAIGQKTHVDITREITKQSEGDSHVPADIVPGREGLMLYVFANSMVHLHPQNRQSCSGDSSITCSMQERVRAQRIKFCWAAQADKVTARPRHERRAGNDGE
jgi:hypothetical protein